MSEICDQNLIVMQKQKSAIRPPPKQEHGNTKREEEINASQECAVVCSVLLEAISLMA